MRNIAEDERCVRTALRYNPQDIKANMLLYYIKENQALKEEVELLRATEKVKQCS